MSFVLRHFYFSKVGCHYIFKPECNRDLRTAGISLCLRGSQHIFSNHSLRSDSPHCAFVRSCTVYSFVNGHYVISTCCFQGPNLKPLYLASWSVTIIFFSQLQKFLSFSSAEAYLIVVKSNEGGIKRANPERRAIKDTSYLRQCPLEKNSYARKL